MSKNKLENKSEPEKKIEHVIIPKLLYDCLIQLSSKLYQGDSSRSYRVVSEISDKIIKEAKTVDELCDTFSKLDEICDVFLGDVYEKIPIEWCDYFARK